MQLQLDLPPRNFDDDLPLEPGLDDLESAQARRAWGEEGAADEDWSGAQWPIDRDGW